MQIFNDILYVAVSVIKHFSGVRKSKILQLFSPLLLNLGGFDPRGTWNFLLAIVLLTL